MKNIFFKKISVAGFSLIEISMALVIGGLLMSGSIAAYRIATVTDPIAITNVNFKKIDVALSKYLAKNGHLPCPARPELKTKDTGAGNALCDGDAWVTPVQTIIPLCSAAAVATETNGAGLCYTAGRDADADSNPDRILIGAVPYIDLGLVPDDSYDGWERKIKYVVTEKLTEALTYDVDMGAIYIVNPESITDINIINGNITPNYRVASPSPVINALYPEPYGSAHFALISNGVNRVNSYVFNSLNKISLYKVDCAKITSSSSFGLDFENCNNDAYFFSNKHKSDLKGEYYYDDLVYPKFRVKPYSDGQWSYSGVKSTATGALPSIVTDKSSGRVGIGTDIPSQSLEVKGNIKADKIYVKKICDASGGNCFKPKLIAGTGEASCPGDGTSKGKVTGFKNGNVQCANTSFTLPIITPLTDPSCLVCNPGICISGCSIPSGGTCTACTSGTNICDAGTSIYGFDATTGAILCR